jgi:GMP synthase (glutamine-hydrolysing)
MAWNLKGKVAKCDHREYGFAQLEVKRLGNEGESSVDALFESLGDEMQVRNAKISVRLKSLTKQWHNG